MPLADHLGRHIHADLFLDTLPYNAHTTTSDALWAGLPVLTQMGKGFAGRVAASLLTTVGLQELITDNVKDYIELALELAENPNRLKEIRTKLAKAKTSSPLFNSVQFTRNLEQAYVQMVEALSKGLKPSHIYM
jgi:predicted O-linked N-acetylglucosamine transferase (SPINDLY family)